jgi:hypothetical protein
LSVQEKLDRSGSLTFLAALAKLSVSNRAPALAATGLIIQVAVFSRAVSFDTGGLSRAACPVFVAVS